MQTLIFGDRISCMSDMLGLRNGSISSVISDIGTLDLEPGALASLSSHRERSELHVLYIQETSRPLEEMPEPGDVGHFISRRKDLIENELSW